MAIKAILFDLDDTLIASGEVIVQHHLKIAEMLGLERRSSSEIAKAIGIPWDGVLKKLWPEIDVEKFKKVYRENSKDYGIKLIDGVSSLLNELKSKFVLGIVTARDKGSAVKYAKKFGIYEYFEHFVTADHEFTKPDPKVFDSTLKSLETKGILKEEVLFVGDSLIDHECAKKAGIDFVAVLTGFDKDFDDVRTINSVAELRSLLKA